MIREGSEARETRGGRSKKKKMARYLYDQEGTYVNETRCSVSVRKMLGGMHGVFQ